MNITEEINKIIPEATEEQTSELIGMIGEFVVVSLWTHYDHLISTSKSRQREFCFRTAKKDLKTFVLGLIAESTFNKEK